MYLINGNASRRSLARMKTSVGGPLASLSTRTCADYVITTYSLAPSLNGVCVDFDNGQLYYENYVIFSGGYPVLPLNGQLNLTSFEISTENWQAR